MQLLRRNSAKELEAAIAAVGGDLSVGTRETVSAVEAYGDELGLQPFGQKGDELEGEIRPQYTARVKRFTEDVGYQGSYNLYSGVAHAELAGMRRLFRQTGTLPSDGTPIHDAGPDPRATHSAVQGSLKAMMGSMERIVFLFGWTAPGRSEEVGVWIDHNNEELGRLTIPPGHLRLGLRPCRRQLGRHLSLVVGQQVPVQPVCRRRGAVAQVLTDLVPVGDAGFHPGGDRPCRNECGVWCQRCREGGRIEPHLVR